ncbi:MAG: type I DNA topoisomerase [Alphaproteobacteria bacterium]|nr:type I DNA topoisomerase [Alphaproteobacteria bacterium]
MHVVVVESPAKAKTIKKYLGPGYEVLASFGHVRDLPPKDGSVRPDEDFAMTYEVDSKSAKRLSDIAKAVKGAENLFLATDPDREGEAISWHVLQVLQEKKAVKGVPVRRVVFNEITRSAVLDAMKHPRDLDMDLINAQQARRALDYLVGFTLSPVLWRKLPGARSAGRVQSVALRLICEREMEIEAFRAQEYWSIEVDCLTEAREPFAARLVQLDGRKLEKFDLAEQGSAEAAAGRIRAARFRVAEVQTKPARRFPFPPFTTSTLQQEASRKLGLSAKLTMQIAQRLYEGVDLGGETVGLITYMRTDGLQMAGEAVAAIRSVIAEDHGANYLPDAPRIYKSKQKNAQEAHEAIRPTDVRRRPEDLARYLDPTQLRLYELIWKRAVACQMEAARLERTSVEIVSEAGDIALRASGSVLLFPGFLRLYEEGRDDQPMAGDDEDARRLPRMAAGQGVGIERVRPEQHFTEPPPRYSEASLVKRLEELGIGRPSTYATILSVLQDRGYVRLENKRFTPEDSGRLVTAFLTLYFERFFAYDFTAGLEEQLDEITERRADWKQVLREFWLRFTRLDDHADLSRPDLPPVKEAIGELDRLIGQRGAVVAAIDEALGPHFFPAREDGKDPRACPSCAHGRLGIKLGKSGAFIGCSNYPDCRHTRPLGVAGEGDGATVTLDGPRLLGHDPESGLPVTLRGGRFGLYVQLGDEAEDGGKPKRASLPKDMPADAVTLEQALRLLALPRTVGIHPESGKEIIAGRGPYGAYLKYDGRYTRLASAEEAIEIGLNRAVTLIAEAAAKGPARRRGPEPLRELGAHPDDGQPVRLMSGRYGPYVTHDGVNATLPRDIVPENLDMTTALALLGERRAKGPVKKKAGGRTAKASRATAKAPAAKEPAAKATKAKTKAKKKPAKGRKRAGKPVDDVAA